MTNKPQINQVTVSIVTYNSQYIFKTLTSFAPILEALPVTIVVHDNGSTADYVTKLQSYASDQIKIIASGENLGFGHGHNATLADTTTPFFLICNPDIIVNQTAFEAMYRVLQADTKQKFGMLTPKIVGPSGDVQYLIRRRLDVFDYMLRFVPFKFVKRLFNKRLSHYECRDLADIQQPINYGSGAFMFTRTSVIKKISGFDERFFMYFEDNDLCDRIRQSGSEIIYVPTAVVTHFYGMASHRSFSGFKIFMRSMRQYFHKWGWRFF